MPHDTLPAREWWHTAIIYQIYPASFKDSNANGWGDIPGIIAKVDYIASLGVDAVWLSPCYISPFRDNGYDISDYRDIDPRFGTVSDIEQLIAELKRYGIKLIMDLVVNHTSDRHTWFENSRSSLLSPKRDWYIWRQGCRLPGGDSTEFDGTTGEFYLHLFATQQPDLNWDNPDVRKAVHDDMRFWLDKGIGGFRMDVINLISKPAGLPDAPVFDAYSRYQPAYWLYSNGPRIHEYLHEIQDVLKEYPGVMSVGEMPFTRDPAELRKFVGFQRQELDMAFQFDIFYVDIGPGGKFTPHQWELATLKSAIAKWQQSLSFSTGAWGTTFLESHDVARSVTRFGDRTQMNRCRVAKMLAMMETTLSGTLFIHQGQEIGMANLTDDIPIEAYSDIQTQNFLRDMLELRNSQAARGKKITFSDVVKEFGNEVRLKARDHGRMPIPWDADKPHAGFSEASGDTKPWMVLNGDWKVCNVAGQEEDVSSVLNFWRRMLAFRKKHARTLVFGDFVPTTLDSNPVFAYHRVPLNVDARQGAEKMIVLLNMKSEAVTYQLPGGWQYSLLESTTGRQYGTEIRCGMLSLEPYESVVLEY